MNKLLIVDLYVSDLCDRSCEYCQFRKSRRGLKMSEATLRKGLGLVNQWPGDLQLQVSGTGEPLLLGAELISLMTVATDLCPDETFMLFTSGSTCREEDEVLCKLAPIANRQDGNGLSRIELVVKYDGSQESLKRVERTLGSGLDKFQLSIQLGPPYTQALQERLTEAAIQLISDQGFAYWQTVSVNGERVPIFRNPLAQFVALRDRAISPVGDWAFKLTDRVEFMDLPEYWAPRTGLYYWALHADGRVAFCENATKGLLPVDKYRALTSLHVDLRALWRRYHNRTQMTQPYVCNGCPVHLGTTTDP